MFTTPDETTAAAADVLGQDKMASIKRVSVRGKFLFHGKSKLWVKGITYGTFSPDENGCQFPSEAVVGQDFSAIADTGFNTVRVYTVPPRWLLDLAQQHGLLVLVGLPWEQHVCFLDDRKIADRILDSCRSAVLQLKGHPSLLAYAIGNEIPGPIVRWHGKVAIERFLKRLYRVVKTCDPKTLITYVNYPTTEYLELPFIDFVSFNVYLEDETNKRSYLKRLHNLVDDRPLLLAEVGLDSLRNGELKQAEVLDWQIRSCFEEGCCGICVFAWTDEWYRGGHEITDWQFGLTTIDRKPKSSLAAVESALAAMPFESDAKWPTFCVVVCSFNGEPTIRDTLEGLTRLNYPDYEVIIIDDGSTDSTARIAAEYPFKLISTENRGLSAARNLGWQTATAEIIAYIDDDAYPDPDWLRFLAIAYRDSNLRAVGGPNLAPDGDGWKADCIACSPGGPVPALSTPWVDSTCVSVPPVTTWTSAGGYSRRSAISASAPLRWSGTIAAIRSRPTGGNSADTDTPRRYSSASGHRNITAWVISTGVARYTVREYRSRCRCADNGFTRGSGGAQRSNPSISPCPACCNPCR
jgi:hypothetical protein